jgi:hypothetical protein
MGRRSQEKMTGMRLNERIAWARLRQGKLIAVNKKQAQNVREYAAQLLSKLMISAHFRRHQRV